MILDSIKLSQREKDHLVQLKRRTKIANWNVLCRWALVTSLDEPSIPPDAKLASDSSVEMTWRVFGGEYADQYEALVRHRCKKDGLSNDRETLAKYFRLHLHRGIGYLFADRGLQKIRNLIEGVAGSKLQAHPQTTSDEDSARQDSATTE